MQQKLLRISNLEANIKDLNQILERENARLKSLQEECNHDIIVISEFLLPGRSVDAKCLFCGKRFFSPHSLRELPKKNMLYVCRSKKFCDLSVNQIYNCVTDKAVLIALQDPNITKNQLYEQLQKFLEED